MSPAESGAVSPLVIFIHLPKTGGSTVRTLLQNIYGRDRSHRFSPMKDLFTDKPASYIRHRGNMLRAYEENPDLKLIYGHVFHGAHVGLDRPCRYLTMLRDPVDRVLSNYYYRAEHGHCDNPAVTLEDYAAGRSPTKAMRFEANNLQARFLSAEDGIPLPVDFGGSSAELLEGAKKNLAALHTFGLTEKFDESLIAFKQNCGWARIPFYTKEKITKRYPGRSRTAPDILALIERNNAADRALYEYARTLFERRWQQREAHCDGELRRYRRLNFFWDHFCRIIRRPVPVTAVL